MQNLINHVVFVLDASSSMRKIAADLIKVVDGQVARLARRSQEADQETRVTIYTFADTAQCVVYEKDVLRLPSIKELYEAIGNTALRDTAILALEDLALTPTKYGDHSFLVYVLTDGQDNRSLTNPYTLSGMIQKLDDNWTVAAMVPDVLAKRDTKEAGFPVGNIAIWDATNAAGVEEAGEMLSKVTDAYMDARASGIRGTRTLFAMDASTVNHKTVAANLKELTGFRVEHVKQPAVIKEFIDSLRPKVPFVQGANYFPLIKRELINDSKEVVIRHKVSGKIYGGPQARALVGLPDTGQVSVSPQPNAEYDVFVQSTSLNRKLIPGHDLLIKV